MKRANFHTMKTSFVQWQIRTVAQFVSFLKQNIFEIEVFLLMSYLLGFYVKIPYVNLVVTPFVYHMMITSLAILLFKPQTYQLIVLTLIGFFIMALLATLHYDNSAQALANVLYFVLWYICIRMMKESKNE